eukprot:m.107867 g.107867  ORF g.107867 m.107867 type:complete len:126 (-) comp9233_c1_seq1:222-599(-)
MVPPESSLLWSLQPVCSLSTPAISILHCTQSFSHPAFEFYGIGLVEMTVGERRSMIVSFSSLKMRLTFQEYFEGLNDEGRHAQCVDSSPTHGVGAVHRCLRVCYMTMSCSQRQRGQCTPAFTCCC